MKKLLIATLLCTGFALAAHAQTPVKPQPRKDKPLAEYKVGAAQITVWEDSRRDRTGLHTEKRFQIEKLYKKGDAWIKSNDFNYKELLDLKAALDKAIAEQAVKTKQ